MSVDFAATAARLAGVAAQLLGWRPGEFWRATPAELVLSLTAPALADRPPSRDEIERMMERDHG